MDRPLFYLEPGRNYGSAAWTYQFLLTDESGAYAECVPRECGSAIYIPGYALPFAGLPFDPIYLGM